jgi:hypothetical protein
LGIRGEDHLWIQQALNVPFDTEHLIPTDDTYTTINLHKSVFPKHTFVGWYYIGAEFDEQIKSIFAKTELAPRLSVILHLDMTLPSHEISSNKGWNLFTFEDSTWKHCPFTISPSSYQNLSCLKELSLVSIEGPEGRK